MGVILIHQYNLKKGIELFGDKAENAVMKELQQIHDMDVYIPMCPKELSYEERAKALSALLFITEKRDGRIKARKCAVGSKQQTYEGYEKSDGTAPTVTKDAVLITGVIESDEERDTATCDIPGAFLHADNDETVLMLLRGN